MGHDRFWDIGATGLILFMIILTLYRNTIFPIFMDVYYHLSIVAMFEQAGGITTIDYLQFAPVGRPHLYPPLYHIILSFFHEMGVSVETLARYSSAATYPLVISVLYYVTSRAYSKMAGFFALVLFISPWILFKETAYFPTSMIAIALCLMAYFAIVKKNYISATAFMVLALYTHMSIPHFFIIPFVILALGEKEKRKNILLSVSISYIAFIPFAWQLVSNYGYINVWHVTFSNNIAIISAAFSILGTIIIVNQVKKRERPIIFLYPLVATAMLLIVYPSYAHRFWYHVQVPLAILASLGIEYIILKMQARYPKRQNHTAIVAVILLLVMVVSYTPMYIYYPTLAQNENSSVFATDTQDSGKLPSETGIGLYPSVISTMISGALLRDSLFYCGEDMPVIADMIKATTQSNDIVLTNSCPIGCYITALTGRASTSGMFKEIEPYQNSTTALPLTKAYLLFFVPDESVDGVTMYAGNKTALMVRETNDVGKVSIPSTIISLEESWILVASLIILALSVFYSSNKI